MHKISDAEILVNGTSYHCAASAACTDALWFSVHAPQLGGMLRVETFRNMFSPDAVCASAMLYAQRKQVTHPTVVTVECGDLPNLFSVVVNPAREQATCVLPVPRVEELEPNLMLLRYPTVTCLVQVSELQSPLPTEVDAELAVICSPDHAQATAWNRTAHGGWEAAQSNGLAAASAAIVFARSFADGVTEHDVQMPGGTAEVGVSIRNGELTGLSVCSSVKIVLDEE